MSLFNRYRERGLSLIPIRPGSKAPLLDGWPEFCDRLPTEAECDAWEARGIDRYGLCMGPSGGVMAVDIDSDDANVLAAVKPSPVRKRGRKGETRFFRYDPNVPSCKVAGCIDVLSYGRQTVMPPTAHPETGEPYAWLTPDTLDGFDPRELPPFTQDDLADLRRALEPEKWESGAQASAELTGGPWRNDDPKRGCPHGSHDRLKRIANALISRGASPDEAVRELLRYDGENHLPIGFFSDATRPDCFADPVSNALHFYASNLRTFNRRQVRSGQPPSVPLVSGSEILEVSDAVRPVAEAWRPDAWPEPAGLLRDLRDLILGSSVRAQPAIAAGGAIAIASVAIANRLRLGDTWPNVYVLNVAPTGAGKSFPYAAAKRLLNPENGLDLLGAGGYRSSTALMKDLLGRRERLDLIDECSGLFKTIRDGGVFQSDMMDILNALWSESSTIFIGPESAGRERVSVWHPCISALLSTTPDGLKNSISREFVTQGFIPRCLIFHDPDYAALQDAVWDEALAARVIRGFQEMAAHGGIGKQNLVSPRPEPESIVIDRAASAALREYAQSCAERLADADKEDLERHFLSRAGQQARKLALIHGALRALRVEELDAEWAIATLRVVWRNSGPILPHMGAENAQETNVMRVFQLIQRFGSITHSRLIGKTRFLKTSERHEILGSLELEGKIQKAVNVSRAIVWSAI